ncbi:MAG: hypothetical protein ACYDDE_00575 [bacterium]
MGYYSELNFTNNAEFKDIDKLNEKISELDGGSSDLIIDKDGEIDAGDGGFSGKFNDDREFANLLSQHVVSGSYELQYRGEDGDNWGYIISANKVIETECIMVPVDIAKKVKEFINQNTV